MNSTTTRETGDNAVTDHAVPGRAIPGETPRGKSGSGRTGSGPAGRGTGRGNGGAPPQRTPAILLRAFKLLRSYTAATGAAGYILDQNCFPVAESMEDALGGQNPCLFCIEYRSHAEKPQVPGDFAKSPCHALHCDAVKKASHYGGSYIYICDLGFMFWTCPVVREGRVAGAFLASGFLGIDPEEMRHAMTAFAGKEAGEESIRVQTASFSRASQERIKALADLLLTCAESLSDSGGDYHETLRRRAMQQTVIAEQLALLREQYPEGGPMPGYPLDREQALIGSLRRGDTEGGKKALDEILGVLFYANPDQFSHIRCRAIELAVLLSRAALPPGPADGAALETNSRYIKEIQDAENAGELTDVLHRIVESMTEQVFSFQGARHAAALQKAERYIRENFTRKISLGEIAENAGLSAPYFSTIFREEMGENLSSYLNRLRVEKAGRFLVETEMSLAEIAGSCGFEDQSWFSKIFKSFTGSSPGRYRSQGGARPQEVNDSNFTEAIPSGELSGGPDGSPDA